MMDDAACRKYATQAARGGLQSRARDDETMLRSPSRAANAKSAGDKG
jgi:hypothetical protein